MFIRTERSIQEFIRFYPVVSVIVFINLLLWLMIDVLQLQVGHSLYHFGVGHNYSVSYGEYWRLVTPIFLHAGLSHVLFNSFALVLFGPALETMIGKVRFIFIYFLTGIIGNVGTYIIDPMSTIPHLGASGAIYGLFGIYIYMAIFRKDLIDTGSAQIIKIIFIIGLITTFIQPNINIAAHIFGFIGGFALGPIALRHAQPFFLVRNRVRRAEHNDDVQFNPNRWQKKRMIPTAVRKNMLWIILGILVIFGIIGRFF